MAGVTDGAAELDDSNGCRCHTHKKSILSQQRRAFGAPDLAAFIAECRVKSLAYPKWQCCDAMQIGGSHQVVVGAAVFIDR